MTARARSPSSPHPTPPTPSPRSDAAFRSMWSDFEWENKVTVNTNFT